MLDVATSGKGGEAARVTSRKLHSTDRLSFIFPDKYLLSTCRVPTDMEGRALNEPGKTLMERKRQRKSDAPCLLNENLE